MTARRDDVPMNTTDAGLPQADLAAIADRIRDCMRRTAMEMVEIGRDLIEAKKKIGHGQFGDWLEREFGWTAKSAQNYMKAAAWAEDKSEIISHLQPGEIRLLSAPSTPQAIQEEVVEAIRAGDAVNFKAIEARVKDERFAARLEKQKQAKSLKKSAESIRRRQREAERDAAKREEEARQRRLLIEEATALLRSLPPPHQARLRQICTELRYASLAEVLPSAAADLEPGR